MTLKKRVTTRLKAFSETLARHRFYRAAGMCASLLASLRIGQRVSVRWDGADWVYRWGNTGAVHADPTYNPKNNETNIDLFYQKYTPKAGDLIVNIGVENGEEIPSFCASVGKMGRVVAVEADPSCCRRLRKLKDMLELSQMSLIEAAVGAAAGEVRFTQDLGSLANRMVKADDYDGKSITIAAKPLEDMLLPMGISRVDFLKVNIEGAEIDLLEGLTGKVDFLNICISCHDFIGPDSRSYDFVKNWLSSAGYNLSAYEPQSLRTPWRNYYLYAARPTHC